MAPLKLLTIDDHPVVISGLRLLFKGDPRFEVCGDAGTPAEACSQAEALQPDMIVTDLVLGGADGVALIGALRGLVPRAAILVYSSHDEMLWARHVLRAGARGYVSKAEPLDAVAVALDAISRGGIHVSVAVQRLLDKNADGSMFDPHDVSVLSARELQILQLIGSGISLQDISQALGLSVKTIGTYRERLKTKLGFDTARTLERFAAGYVAADPAPNIARAMTPFAWIARRWDIDANARTSMPFRSAIALLNVKRVELACLLVMMSNALEVAVGHRQQALLLDFLLAPAAIAFSCALRRSGSVRARQIMVAAFIVMGLVITQSAAIELAANGSISRGYTVRLLLMTLLFVLPPRTLAALLVFLTATFCAVVLNVDASDRAKLEAILGAITVTVIAQLAGWLIYAARRTDHEQRVLIESQNARLEAQNAELDQLMAITAHDLRSPLYGLRNLFDLASRREAQEPALPGRVLRDGIRSLDAMIGLVTRLLRAHQAEHAPLMAVVHDDLREHVRAAAQRIAPVAEVQAVTIGLDLPDDPLPARFDGGALAQILDNLLANGVRYTPAGQPLRLAARAVAGEAILVVADSGPGIDPALLPALFRKFHRGTHAHEATGAGSRGTGGKASSGMGLFIAATYAARIGARLSFRPGEPGGAVFELALPLTARG